MSRIFWREQQAAVLVAVVGGLIFWLGYGIAKGLLFALVIFVILQVPIWITYRKGRR